MKKFVTILILLLVSSSVIMLGYSDTGKRILNMSISQHTTKSNKTKLNKLADSNSPYLLKHSTNPINWYEWGDEALEKAKRENKLIFLSIGYTACHWCNELEEECFRHEDFADVINDRYISIKVDREQRPDIDAIYMEAAMVLQGHGGWPNNVFLTPNQNPIYALGYQKRDVFKQILVKVDEYWKKNRDEVIVNSGRIAETLRKQMETGNVGDALFGLDMAQVRDTMDRKFGGFGSQNKFPHSSMLEFLLLEKSDDKFLQLTLDQMADGGMYDHVGGGFHRYTVDPKWEIPHFEKMLYDNAVLISLYAKASILFNNVGYVKLVKKSLEFIERELMNEDGGFLSSIDADSDGEEGKYYLWSLDDVERIVGDSNFIRDYGLSKEGNMFDIQVTESGPVRVKTGTNTLRKITEKNYERSLEKLFEVRQTRTRPMLDDKVIASWHSMMVSAFARSSIWLNEPNYLKTAIKSSKFILDKIADNHWWRKGDGGGEGTLDDYAYAAMAFWDLFEVTGSEDYLQLSKKYADIGEEYFSAGDGGYFLVRNNGKLIIRPRVVQDRSIPSSAAVLGRVNLRLSIALNEPQREEMARKTAAYLLRALNGANISSAETMILWRELSQDRIEVVYAFADDETDRASWLTSGLTRYFAVLRIPLGADSLDPLLQQGRLPASNTMAYVCKNKVCLTPSITPNGLKTQLENL